MITDVGFRVRFFSEPASACHDQMLDLTAAELSALLQLDARELQRFAARLDPRVVRAVGIDHQSGPRIDPVVARAQPPEVQHLDDVQHPERRSRVKRLK